MNDPRTPVAHVSFVGTGLDRSMEAQWGDDFVAIESPDFPATPPLRAKSDDKGNFEFFLPSQQFYHLTIFDPVTGLVGHETDATERSGQRTLLVDTMVFQGSTEPDTDYDGLPDDIEFAIGTNPNKADTDGDGVDDFVAVLQGGDPLGGRAAVTGIIAQVPMTDARDVVVLPNARGDALLAYVVTSPEGLVIVDVTRTSQPTVVGRLALGGQSPFISVDPVWQVAVVATTAGPHLVDVSDPASPKLIQTHPANAASPAVAVDGYAYFEADYGKLYALNIRTGEVEQEMALPGNYITGLVREGNFLYAMDPNGLLRIIEIHGAQMRLRGALQAGSAIQRFSVANGVAYLPSTSWSDPQSGTVSIGSYATVDVADPDKPVMIGKSNVPLRISEPGEAMTVSGSGSGLLIGMIPGGTSRANVMDVSDPKNTYAVVTRFPLPDRPHAVAIASGTAFIANGPAGLVILNYQAFDVAGRAPVVNISGVFAESAPSKLTTDLLEGSRFRVQAGISDDAQVRNVELLVNGRVVDSSVSAPGELEGFAPVIAGASNTFVVQVRATDTGGNVGVSQPTVIQLLRDTTPPVLLKSDPMAGEAKLRGFDSIRLFLSEPLADASLTPANFEIIHENGTLIRPSAFVLLDFNREVNLTTGPLNLPGEYRFIIHAAAIADRAGNPLGAANLIIPFSVSPYSIRWDNSKGGTTFEPGSKWFTATNWFPQRVPGPQDWVLIDVPNASFKVHMWGRPRYQPPAGILY